MFKHLAYIYLDGIAPVLPLIALAVRVRQIHSYARVSITTFFAICLLGYLSADILGDIGKNNLYIYNVMPTFLVLIMSVLFQQVLKKKQAKRVSLFFAFSFFFIEIITFESSFLFQSFASIYFISFSLFFILNTVTYYWQEFRQIDDIPVWNKLEFWFITIILFYTSLSAVVWAVFKYLTDRAISLILTKDEQLYIGDLWVLHNITFFIACLLFSFIIVWRKFKNISQQR